VIAFGKADAAQTTTKQGDFDGDGDVDFSDFLLFAAGFGKTSADTDFSSVLDLSSNGAVDFDDFLIFATISGSKAGSSEIVR